MAKENFEDEAWDAIHKANEETLKNLKEDEALFDGMAFYTQKKSELNAARAFVSYTDNSIEVLWSEDAEDKEFVEDYITSQGDKIPFGTFFIEFWWKNEQTSYEYDEWDYVTSLNFNIEVYSSLNFEQTFKNYKQQTQKLQAISKRLKEHCNNCPCEYDCRNHNLDDMDCPCFDILEILKGEENNAR